MKVIQFSNSRTDGSNYDLVIVGGGMVGISLSLLLASRGVEKILIVEAKAMDIFESLPASYSPSFDSRSTALSWTSRNIFQSLGIWDQLKRNLSQINQIHVSDRHHGGLARMDAAEEGIEALGYVVENGWLGSVLIDHLKRTGVDILAETEVEKLVPLKNGIEITVKSNASTSDATQNTICTNLVVVADGAESNTASKLGIRGISIDYNQTAMIANVQLQKSHSGIAYERFTDQGPIALLPLPNSLGEHRGALVWVVPKDSSEGLMKLSNQSFLDELQRRFGYRGGYFIRIGNRSSYPLSLKLSNEQVRRNLIIMGNAAHSLHPVAGQGFNLSLRDANALSIILQQAQSKGQPIGSLDVLERYTESQSVDQRNTIFFSDNLTKFFSGSSAPAATIRNFGLISLDLLPPLRHRLARFGMGLAAPGVRNERI